MRTVIAVLMLVVVAACSMAPANPVTRQDLAKTRIYNRYVVEESPEELLYALNTRGEVVVESKRNIPGKDFKVYLKLLATPDGLEVLEYDR